MSVNLPNGKEEMRVFLDSSANSIPPAAIPSLAQQNGKQQPQQQWYVVMSAIVATHTHTHTDTEVPKTDKKRPISEIASKFHQLLECSPGTKLPLRSA